MYSGQGNYTPQFRQGPPPYQQPMPGPPRFVQAPPGPSIPPAPPGPQVHQLGQQAAPFFGQLPVPPTHQPIRFPPPPTSSSQYCQQLSVPPPPPPLQANVSVPVGSQFSMAGFSTPIPLQNSNVHLGMQPPPPPRILPPAPQFISQPQGQVLYHNSHPPRPGMLHAPPHPPWPSNGPILPPSLPPPSFDSAIPAQFTGQHIAGDAHPPSIPPPPSPPPPPPPSSPPPIPPSPPTPIPASEAFPNDSLEVVPTTSKNNSREFEKAHAHLCDGSKGLINGNKDFMADGKASENHALSPPRPEEVVVRNMEVLCQFIAKVGPDFENIARGKEAGNPKFDFLFGGEPGSAAAIAHEYFQWMKMKYIAERKPPKGLVTADTSSKRGHFERLNTAHSPATSDMDMEDDISPDGIDKGFSYTNKQSSSANAHSIKVQLHNEIHFASGTSSPVTSLMDADDEKDSSVFEDVSPDRGLPDPVALGERTHEPSTISSKASNHGKFSSNNENPKSQEDLGVYLKYGSPFRLIQGYASDESDNENVRNCNDEISNAARTPVITAGTSSLQQEKQPQSSCLNFDTQNLSTVGIESMAQHSPSRLQGTVRYPNKTVPSTNNSDIMRKDLDPDVVQVEELLKDRSEVSEPSSKYDVPKRKEMDANQEIGKFHSNECLPEKNDSHIVDEFGRLVREGASGSDSDGSQYIERHAKRDRSRSMSRSPQGSRWRHRSRSPRKRDRRSRSRSWSPKRGRSRSPQPFRSNMPAWRGRNLPPDCFNFVRGRCFYGASCRFLHRDSGPMNMQHRYQDSRKPRYLDRFDDLSLSRIRHHDKAGAAEFHAEKRHKLSEADDILIRTSFGKFSDGKDEPIPTLEAENASIPGSQEMIPETEDTNNLLNIQHRYQDIRKSRYLDRFDDLPLSRVSHQNMPGVVELHAEKPYKLAEEDDIITKTYFGKFSDGKDGPLPTPEAEDTSNLRFQGMIPEIEDTNNMRNMQHHYQDLPKHRYLDRFDDVPLSRISQHDMAAVSELHAEKPDKLAEADDIVAKTSFNKFSDGKDELIPTLEAENASNLVYQGLIPDTEVTKMPLSQEMAPGAEDSGNPAVQKMTIEEDTNNLVTQEMTPDAEDNINPVSPEMTPEAEDTNNRVFQEMIPEAEDAVNRLSPEMESEPEGASNLASQERILDAEDDINQEVVRLELEPPVGNGLFACVDDVTIQPVAETSEPLHTDSYLVRSPPNKNESSPHHTDFEQPSLDDTFSSEPPQLNTFASTSFMEKPKEHALPSQISQSATVPVQATSSQTNVGVNVAFEETANQITCSQIIASIEPSVQAFHQEISSHNILISGSNFPSPPRLSLPPPPPHGHHASPFLPPPPQQIQHMMRTPNDSSQPSSQQFREDIALPMTSYQSQSLPPSYMFYPQRSSLPSNLPPQPNLPWSDQHMLPALSRPPFPSSEASQLHNQHNFFPPRNDFTPLARPYPPSEVLGSRPSDFYPQAFHSVPSVNPRPLQSFPNGHGGMPIHNQGLVASSTSIPLLRPFQADHLDPRSYPGEVSTSHLREINQPLHIQQNPSSFGTAGMMHHSMQRYTDNNFQIRPSDVGVPRFPIREHYNPYASTFEQPLRGDPGFPGLPISRFDSSQRASDIPTVGIGFERSLSEQSLPKPRSYMHETSVEKLPDVKKQLVQEPMASAQYDPLFDSIEPSPNASKVRVEEQNSGINDTGSASKRRATKAGSKKNKGGLAPEPKAEVDELGEVATDADAGGVENESPQLVDDKDWSPLLPFDVGEANVGEIEINQIRSPSKSKKNKDSRSVKLFKVAVADFAKEVLKPSWRQGNLSKEAFKTIVKKTVDKVAGAVPSYQVPKSQAKINQYMETSQRKLTKLVLGYVDKYVKI